MELVHCCDEKHFFDLMLQKINSIWYSNRHLCVRSGTIYSNPVHIARQKRHSLFFVIYGRTFLCFSNRPLRTLISENGVERPSDLLMTFS